MKLTIIENDLASLKTRQIENIAMLYSVIPGIVIA